MSTNSNKSEVIDMIFNWKLRKTYDDDYLSLLIYSKLHPYFNVELTKDEYITLLNYLYEQRLIFCEVIENVPACSDWDYIFGRFKLPIEVVYIRKSKRNDGKVIKEKYYMFRPK